MIGQEEKQAIIDLFPFMGERPIVVDCGSNKGDFSDIVLDEFGDNCELHLIEPNLKLLSYTEIKYEYRKNIKYHNWVAFKEDRQNIRFHYFENYNNELSSIYNGKEDWEGLPMIMRDTVAIKIDTFCEGENIERIDFLKIDCEGADFDVLLGCEIMLKEDRIGIVQLEYSAHWKRGNNKFSDLASLCGKHGYSIYRYEGDNFWKVDYFAELYICPYDNYYITKYEIQNHSVGWNTQFILNTAELPKFDLCLEVGAFEGLTTKYICQNMLNEGGRANVIDPLEDYYVEGDTEHPYFKNQYQRFKRNTRGLYINLHRGKSEDVLPTLNALRHDFVFIDGNHFGNHPYIDGCWAFAITKVGGYILFDDYTWRPETTAAIDKFLDEFNGFYDLIQKNYQVLIRKVTNRYNEITQNYYL